MSIKEALHESIPCVTAMMRPMYEKIDPLKFGEHRRMLFEGEEYAKRLLKMADHPNCEEIAAKLVQNYPVHDFVINRQEASEQLELPVKNLDEEDLKLIQPVISLARVGFYGFLKQKKNARSRKHTTQKRLTVVPKAAQKEAT